MSRVTTSWPRGASSDRRASLAAAPRTKALDGLRGVACLLVLLHHCGRGAPASWGARLYTRASGAGWIGVDLFFVLSGFLITGLLLEARGREEGLRRFWLRRAVRILPLAYAYLAVVLFSPLWRAESWHSGVYAEQAWFWLYANNWLSLRSPSLDYGLLAHFWSLAIEEQFYLLWPLLVLRLRPDRLATLCLVCASASLAGHILAAALRVPAALVHSLTPSHLDGLLLGSWLSVFVQRRREANAPAIPYRPLAAGATGLALLVLLPARGLPATHPWVIAVGLPCLALIFTLLLAAILFAPHGAPLRRFFEATALTGLGRVSYGFYVLHFPIVALLRRHYPSPDGSLLDCVRFYLLALFASTAAAAVSWLAFERPLLRLRPARQAPGAA